MAKELSTTEKNLKQSSSARAYARGLYDAVTGDALFYNKYINHPLKSEYDYGFHNGLIVRINAGLGE